LIVRLTPAPQAASDGQRVSFDRSFRMSIPAEQGHRDCVSIRVNEATEISWKRIGTPIIVPARMVFEWNGAKPETQQAKHDFSFHLIPPSPFGGFLSV